MRQQQNSMEQFKNSSISKTYSEEQVLRKTQDIILNTLENILQPDFDFKDLALIFQSGYKCSPSDIVFKLVQYFIKCVEGNFINLKSYQCLQAQTQKLEGTIRSHIKIEQEMKMYLEYLESKISKYENQKIKSMPKELNEIENQLQVLKSRESVLMKEKMVVLKENERLRRELEKKLTMPIEAILQTNFQENTSRQKQNYQMKTIPGNTGISQHIPVPLYPIFNQKFKSNSQAQFLFHNNKKSEVHPTQIHQQSFNSRSNFVINRNQSLNYNGTLWNNENPNKNSIILCENINPRTERTEKSRGSNYYINNDPNNIQFECRTKIVSGIQNQGDMLGPRKKHFQSYSEVGVERSYRSNQISRNGLKANDVDKTLRNSQSKTGQKIMHPQNSYVVMYNNL